MASWNRNVQRAEAAEAARDAAIETVYEFGRQLEAAEAARDRVIRERDEFVADAHQMLDEFGVPALTTVADRIAWMDAEWKRERAARDALLAELADLAALARSGPVYGAELRALIGRHQP